MSRNLSLMALQHLQALLQMMPSDQYPILRTVLIHAPDALQADNYNTVIPKARLINDRLYLEDLKEYRSQGRNTSVEWLVTGLWRDGHYSGWQQALNCREGYTEYCFFKDGKRVEYTLQQYENKQFMKDYQPPFARMRANHRFGFQKVYMMQSLGSEEPDEVVFQFGDGYKRIIRHRKQLGLTDLMQGEGLPISRPLLAVLETKDLLEPFTSSIMRVCDDLYVTIPQIPQVQLLEREDDMKRLLSLATKILPSNNTSSSRYLLGRELALLSMRGE